MKRLWIKLTCHWLVIGAHCARHGHQWREWPFNGSSVKSCAWCGKLRGLRVVRSVRATQDVR